MPSFAGKKKGCGPAHGDDRGVLRRGAVSRLPDDGVRRRRPWKSHASADAGSRFWVGTLGLPAPWSGGLAWYHDSDGDDRNDLGNCVPSRQTWFGPDGRRPLPKRCNGAPVDQLLHDWAVIAVR